MAERASLHENPQVRTLERQNPTDASNDGKTGRLDKTLTRLRSTRAGRISVKIAVIVGGAIVLAIGLVLVPLPGPGWLIVFAGLAIWSIEFQWARGLHVFVRRQVGRWTSWYVRQGWALRILVGGATGLFVLAVVCLSLYVSLGAGAFTWLG